MLGIKVILFFFKFLFFFIVLGALVFILKDLSDNDGSQNEQIGIAVLTRCLQVFAVQSFLIKKKTNSQEFSLVKSFYEGLNLTILGIIIMVSLSLFAVFLVSGVDVLLPFIVLIVSCFALCYSANWFFKFSSLTKTAILENEEK